MTSASAAFTPRCRSTPDDIILTDLESTNGTRVNGMVVQIRRLRHGDRLGVGRSLVLFGSNEEIAHRMASGGGGRRHDEPRLGAGFRPEGPVTLQTGTIVGGSDSNFDFDLNVNGPMSVTREALVIGNKALPPLPQKLTPSQAARLAEILDYLHHGLTLATENIQAKEDGSQVTLGYSDWQRVQAIHMLLARYLRHRRAGHHVRIIHKPQDEELRILGVAFYQYPARFDRRYCGRSSPMPNALIRTAPAIKPPMWAPYATPPELSPSTPRLLMI